jgi:hypothetical protein
VVGGCGRGLTVRLGESAERGGEAGVDAAIGRAELQLAQGCGGVPVRVLDLASGGGLGIRGLGLGELDLARRDRGVERGERVADSLASALGPTNVSLPRSSSSEPRSTYSIAMYGVPSSSKESWTVTMFGCESDPATRESRTRRSANEGSLARNVASSFKAMKRSRSVWRAR